MKKRYITPTLDIINQSSDVVLYTYSVGYGGQGGSEHSVDSKKGNPSFGDDWDDDDFFDSDIEW